MSKPVPILNFPFLDSKEVSSEEFSLNVKSSSPGKILYRSSNESIAVVNEYGFVSTICAGTVTLFVEQLETEEFSGIELCRNLVVQKSNQRLIIEELQDGIFTEITEIKKRIDEKFVDIKFTLNSNLNVFIESLNLDYFDFILLEKNVFRIFPRRVGIGSILISSNGNDCYNSYQQVLLIEILEKNPLVTIDLIFSPFTRNVKHDALDEFTIITSNSGQQQVDNSFILQTTLDSKVGNGYSRDIGIINEDPHDLINYIENNVYISCCTGILLNSSSSSSSSSSFSGPSESRLWKSVAMSSDGQRQTAVADNNQIYVSTNFGQTWSAKESNRPWSAVAISSNGQYQTAVMSLGQDIYISNDFGDTWSPRFPPALGGSYRAWTAIAMSSNGQYQTAVVNPGQIYISNDFGNSWEYKESNRFWEDVAMSSNGQYQTAVELNVNGQIYISNDFGNTWAPNPLNEFWCSIAMSNDGQRQTAGTVGDQIYVSTNFGQTWEPRGSSNFWRSVAMSSDGQYQTAGSNSDQIYVSTDYGNTWSPKDSNRGWVSVAISSNGQRQIAGGYNDPTSGGQIYASTDFGNTWIAIF
jgi:photosystem II stability/assembly factor-like uncharacterized protein